MKDSVCDVVIQFGFNFCDVQRYAQWLPTKQIPTQRQQLRH